MLVELKIPQQGLTIESVRIVNWNVKPGDIVNIGDIVLTIESEKSLLEVESPAKGRISKLLKDEGEEATIGEVVAIIEQI